MFNNIYKGKKVLITGNTGFKGSWLSIWLDSLGAEIYGVSLDTPTEHVEPLTSDKKSAFWYVGGYLVKKTIENITLKAIKNNEHTFTPHFTY